MSEVCNTYANADFLIELTKYLYTRQLTLLLHLRKLCSLHHRIFEKHPFFTSCLLVFTLDEVRNNQKNPEIPSNLAKYQYFTQGRFIFASFRNKVVTLHRKSFSKHPLFTTFSLVLTVSEVCNTSNKYLLPCKSVTKIFLQKTSINASSFQQKFCVLHSKRF